MRIPLDMVQETDQPELTTKGGAPALPVWVFQSKSELDLSYTEDPDTA